MGIKNMSIRQNLKHLFAFESHFKLPSRLYGALSVVPFAHGVPSADPRNRHDSKLIFESPEHKPNQYGPLAESSGSGSAEM